MERRLAAILAADMVGYSRLMGADEEGTITRQRAHHEALIDPQIASHGGRIVKTMGDGLLVEFPSVVDALKCAVALQAGLAEREGEVPDERRIQYRIGINLGDIVIDGDDILGDGVNVAARLEGLAEPGGICISDVVHQSVEGKLDLSFTDMGAQQVKNIARPVRAFQVLMSGPANSSTEELPLPDKPSIAVLPFDNLSGDPDREFFADGLTEDLITALSYWHTFYVIARHSTFQYKGQSPDIRQVASDLGVHYVLEGSVQTAGDRVRITAQLIDATTGLHVWAERYDRRLEDFFALQDEITQEIAAKVEPAFAKAEQQKATRKSPTNLAAWEWYQRGIATLDGFFKAGNVQGKTGNLQARECFKHAMEIDPSDSRPVAYLAYAHFRSVLEGYSTEPEADIGKTIEYAKRAIDLDEGNPYAHFAYSIGLTYSGQPELGIPEARRAVELNPNYSHAYIPLGNGLNLAGEPAEGVLYLEKAIKLNPTDPRNHAYFTFLAEAQLNNRDYEQAIETSRTAIERNSDYPYAHFVLASALGHLGQIEAAGEALNTCLKLRPDCIETHPQLALFKNPEDRDHILEGLRKAGWSEPEETEPPLPDKPSIAVLPFDNMSGDPEQEYFSDGMAEDLITDLSKISSLSVAARNSSFSFKGQMPDIKDVVEKLGVTFVLEGSVRKMGDRIRINAQLIYGADGRHIWAERYDGNMAEIFEFQDNIREQIVAALQVSLTPADKALTERKPTDSVDAYDLFLKGRANYFRYTSEDFLEAIKCFEEAIEIDPNFADAYGYLSYCHFHGWSEMFSGFEDTLDRAHELAERGVALDGTSAIAVMRLGWVQTFLRRYDQAIANMEKAIALAPNNAEVYSTYGEVLNYLGNPERALEMLEKALSIDTIAPPNWEFHVGHSHFLLRHYDQALARLNRTVERIPKFTPAYVLLACTYAELDRLDDARGAIKTVLGLTPQYTVKEFARIYPFRIDEIRNRFLDGLRKAGLPEGIEAEEGPPPLPDKPSIAVLPFDNMSGDPEQEYFVDGITEDIITELSKISGLFVIARHSAFTYKGKSITLQQVGRELGVRCVLEGSVRKVGNRLRITAQLVDTATDLHLWAERYDRELEDIFAIQDEVARNVADALAVILQPGESENLARVLTDDISVYDLYLRARTHPWPPIRSNIDKAQDAYGGVIDVDPSFAGGFAGKSLAHAMAVLFGQSDDSDSDMAAAMKLARQAVELDSAFALSHSALGLAHAAMGEMDEAIASARRAIELQPGDADSHAWLSRCLMWAGYGEEASDEIRISLRLDPNFVEGPYLNQLARVSFISGRYEEALEAYERNDARGGPGGDERHAMRAAAYGHLGRVEEAKRELQALSRDMPDVSIARILQGHGVRSDREKQGLIDGLRKAGLQEE